METYVNVLLLTHNSPVQAGSSCLCPLSAQADRLLTWGVLLAVITSWELVVPGCPVPPHAACASQCPQPAVPQAYMLPCNTSTGIC